MRGSARACLAAVAAALVLGACSTVEPQRGELAPLPEPPPWNSIEMIWLDTEIALLERTSLRCDSPRA